jgi:hypothetical protein
MTAVGAQKVGMIILDGPTCIPQLKAPDVIPQIHPAEQLGAREV